MVHGGHLKLHAIECGGEPGERVSDGGERGRLGRWGGGEECAGGVAKRLRDTGSCGHTG